MRKTMSLRGTFDCADNAISVDNQVFSNEAQQLDRGWKVMEAWVWPKTVRAEIGAADGQITFTGSLATDDGCTTASFGPQAWAGDNRQIGWFMNSYQFRNAGTDFLARNAGGLIEGARLLIDPDHLVTQGLYMNIYVSSDSTTSPVREFNYLVILEKKKVTPSEAILSIVKAAAQDVVN